MLKRKELILKTVELMDNLKESDIIEIIEDDGYDIKTNKYKFAVDEYDVDNYELVSLTEEDTIWDWYNTFESMKYSLISDVARGRIEDINISK